MTKNREKFITFFSYKKLDLLRQMCLRKCMIVFCFVFAFVCVCTCVCVPTVVFAAIPSRADCSLNNHNIRASSIKYNFSSGGHRMPCFKE